MRGPIFILVYCSSPHHIKYFSSVLNGDCFGVYEYQMIMAFARLEKKKKKLKIEYTLCEWGTLSSSRVHYLLNIFLWERHTSSNLEKNI